MLAFLFVKLDEINFIIIRLIRVIRGYKRKDSNRSYYFIVSLELIFAESIGHF